MILMALNRAGVNVPTLCHVDGLTPTGACRMCVVEVDGQRNLTPSCAYPVAPGMNRTGELLLSELGNIIMNSFVVALSNTLKRIFMPSAPRCLKGEPQYLLEAMGVAMDVKQRYRIISIKLEIHCDHRVTWSEVLGLIPEKLAQELLAV